MRLRQANISISLLLPNLRAKRTRILKISCQKIATLKYWTLVRNGPLSPTLTIQGLYQCSRRRGQRRTSRFLPRTSYQECFSHHGCRGVFVRAVGIVRLHSLPRRNRASSTALGYPYALAVFNALKPGGSLVVKTGNLASLSGRFVRYIEFTYESGFRKQPTAGFARRRIQRN